MKDLIHQQCRALGHAPGAATRGKKPRFLQLNATRCFILWEGEGGDVVQIPTSALFRHRDRWGVLLADQGRARLRLVEVGRHNGLWSQITMGLEPGEIVVTPPGDRVHDRGRIAAEIRPYA